MSIPVTNSEDAVATCTVCGCSSTWRAAFAEIKDGSVKRLCCPACARKLRVKWSRISLAVLPLALALGIYLHPMMWRDPIHVLVLFSAIMLVSQYLLIVLHELGHALVAGLVGAPAYAIIIGGEPWLLDLRMGGIRWRIGYWIPGGLTYHAPCDGPHARRNSILITAAGPLTNLLISAVAIPIAICLPGKFGESLWRLALLAFGVASALQFVFNAWPRHINTAAGKLANDAARIVALSRGAADDTRTARGAEIYLRATFAFADRDFESAARAARQLQAECVHPELATAAGILCGAALSESDRVEEAVAQLQQLLATPTSNAGLRAGLEDNLAWAYLLVDDPTTLEKAIPLIENARAAAPWDDSFAITHACLLAAAATAGNGRVAQAKQLLSELRAPHAQRQNRGYAALARGLIAAAVHDREAARREFENAKSQGATAAPLRLLERRLASS